MHRCTELYGNWYYFYCGPLEEGHIIVKTLYTLFGDWRNCPKFKSKTWNAAQQFKFYRKSVPNGREGCVANRELVHNTIKSLFIDIESADHVGSGHQ